jgi:hypothetical protein
MGGTTARIAAAVLAACGMLALAAPAQAGAAGTLDDSVRGLAPVSQEIGAIAQPAADSAVSIVRDPAKVPPPIERETPVKGSDRGAAPATPVQSGPRSTHRVDRSGAPPIERDIRPARLHVRAGTNRPSLTHGRKAMPPARSHAERAGGSAPVRSSEIVTAPAATPAQPGPGLTGIASSPGTVTGMILTAFLIAAIAACLPFLLNWLRIPATIVRRPALAPLLEPPG